MGSYTAILLQSWSRRMGHSPVKGLPASPSHANHTRPMARSSSQQRISGQGHQHTGIYPVEVAEWVYEPKRSSSKSAPPSTNVDTFKGPITFRTWDFEGVKQREQLPMELAFFTRRCLFLLLWKVTDGEIALAELQEWLIAIQERAPNSSVLIVGTHSDFVREQAQRFPREYLAGLDQQIQDRFIVGADPEKGGLPRVLGSLYVCCRSREDVKSLCTLVYACCASGSWHAAGGTTRNGMKLRLAEKVPASFVALERVVVNMTDEMRATGREPILHFQQFWSAASERLLLQAEQEQQQPKAKEKRPAQFRDVQDFRQACLFLHENGVLCYFDDTLLRDFLFLDPPWLCSILHGTLASISARPPLNGGELSASPASTNFSQIHQNALVDTVELYTAMKRAIKRHVANANTFMPSPSKALQNPSPSEHALAKQFSLFRQCGMSLLRKLELALPCQNGRLSLLASYLPDEYLLRADYPGAKVRTRTKLDKLKLRWHKLDRPRSMLDDRCQLTSPIRNYLEHRRLSRALPAVNIENNGSEMAANREFLAPADANDLAKILEMDQCKEEYLRRLYLLHYVPQGFWPRLIMRLLDDERLGNALAKLFILSRLPGSTNSEGKAEEDGAVHRSEAVATALARTLNAGRALNLVQRTANDGHGTRQNGQKDEADEEETSFIVLNPAEEVTEESSGMASDDEVPTVVRCCEKGVEASDEEDKASSLDGNGIEWLLWRTGLEVRSLGTFLLSLRQFLPLASVQDLNYSTHQLYRQFEDGQWHPLTSPNDEGQQHGVAHMLELLVPRLRIRLRWHDALWELSTDRAMAARVLVLVSSIVDDLLEDWYPQLGTRFVHSSQGALLVDRLIPCDRCSIEAIQEEERYWLRENINRNPAASADFLPSRPTRSASTKFGQKTRHIKKLPKSKSSTTTPLNVHANSIESGAIDLQKPSTAPGPSPVYLFSMEECILEARRALKGAKVQEEGEKVPWNALMECPRHGKMGWRRDVNASSQWQGPDLARMCPDLLFIDLEGEWLIAPEHISRGKLLGRGAFGFVFSGILLGGNRHLRRAKPSSDLAALKVLEPVEHVDECQQQQMPRASAQAAFRAFALKWQNDLLEQATRAYCTARQELCMLSELAHPHCTQMLAFCAQPMTLVLELAPHGSLDKILAEFRRCGQRLHVESVQRASLQIAKALEYLHVQQHIIYRDLKSENVLVWRFPAPTGPGRPRPGSPSDVLLKLGDYGISRFSYPSGVCKGYGGTEGFMAPEVMRYSGEQEYTERVDCFSFGMFLYELLCLRQPYEGHQLQQMKERILEAQRPTVSEKELLQPTNLLDLMVACWQERAENRPSSSQLVGIASAPEFGHLLDMALLRDGEGHGQGQAMAIVPLRAEFGQQWTCWIPIERGHSEHSPVGRRKSPPMTMALLQCSQFGWTEKKLYCPPLWPMASSPSKKQQPIPPQPKITTLCQVFEDFLWLGDEAGKVAIFTLESGGSGQLGEQLFTLDVAKALDLCPGQIVQFRKEKPENGGEWEQKEGEEPVHEPLKRASHPSASEMPSALSILHFGTFPERQIVLVALGTAILLCRWHGTEMAPQLVNSIRLGTERLLAMAILPSLGDWQIWTGHSRGQLFLHHISSSTDRLAFSTSASHFDEKKPVPKASAVLFLLASRCVKNLVWSGMEKDSRLFMWRDSQLQKQLNCAKILPVSESLSSMEMASTGADEADGHFITALELIDLEGSAEDGQGEEQLLAGTNRGILVVINAIEMTPLSCFRPFFGQIHRILACPPANSRQRLSTSRILQNELLSAANLPPSTSSPQILTKPVKKRSAMLEKSRTALLKAAGLQGSMDGNKQPMERQKSLDMPSTSISEVGTEVRNAVDEFCEAVKHGMRGIFAGNETKKEKQVGEEEADKAFFVTIGTDYRPLLDRFVGNETKEKQQRQTRSQEQCAIFWRATSNWSQPH